MEDENQVDIATEQETVQPAAEGETNAAQEEEFDDVSIDNFDLHEQKDWEDALLDVTRKKRKAYAQAKAERLEKERLQAEIEQIRSNQKMEVNEEIAKLKAEKEAIEAAHAEAMRLVQVEKNKQAELRFSHAAEKHNVTDSEFVKFQLSKQISSLDDAALDSFDINAWMNEQKSKHPIAFGATTRQPATSGAAPQGASSTGYETKVSSKPALTEKGRKETESGWKQFLQENGLG